MDLSRDPYKIIDNVKHDVLFSKLNMCGVRGLPLKLINSYLNGRSQYTVELDPVSDEMLRSVPLPVGKGHMQPNFSRRCHFDALYKAGIRQVYIIIKVMGLETYAVLKNEIKNLTLENSSLKQAKQASNEKIDGLKKENKDQKLHINSLQREITNQKQECKYATVEQMDKIFKKLKLALTDIKESILKTPREN
ncbi:hypothetical protein HHI36_005677 [Cryptolaemus montrouzieri]|uniref:Uncharacterized protein n=1 Tax=Cryptolaemus montrouzieri TaxID=559131 RepID=A0ABD2NV36_9CUCU